MEFRILGPLEVSEEGQPLDLGGAKQRALLAALLLDANRVASKDRLIHALWDERPPETAAKALQVYVSQLRKLLGAKRLVTRAPGYVINVEPGELDVERFERLVEEGGAGRLKEALALWRGPPLADFGFEPFAQAEIARLEELRLTALEERIEADLALGRHGTLVGELEALVAEYPLRERIRGQLMLALYRSGRQAEALEAYKDARHVLSEELGIEPTRALQDLERCILVHDSALDVVPRAEPSVEPRLAVEMRPPEPAPAPSQERKLATVLFADLVGATELGEQDPERTRALLERFYDAKAREIEGAGGTVEKFIGDAVMAAFGVPASQEDHVERALHAALAMQRSFQALFGDSLGLRIGVNTGDVVVGQAWEGGSFVTGDAVNVAARLEQAAAPGEILAGERTAMAARGAFEFADATTAEAKGKPLGIGCRRVLGALALARPRGVAGLRRSFIGRERELDLLRTTYERAEQGAEPHLVTIVGDAGVGKSSLVRQFLEYLRTRAPEPLVRAGRCLPYGRGITYWPLGDVLKEHLGILESDSPETVRERLGERAILGLTLGLEVAPELHPLAARERLHEAWVELLDEVVAVRPAAVLVEDLHWAEEPLLDLLGRLLRDVSGPLLLLTTARPELLDRRPSWGAGRLNAAQLWLEPLSPEEAARMLEELLGSELPARLRQLVLERAEGNPLFLEELVGALIDRRFLARMDGGWQLGDLPARFEVPDSVQAVLAARIDLLGGAEKAALQAAAVIGRVFWAGPVIKLLDEIEADLGVLVERDFIRRRPISSLAGEREFAFKHALTRDVAYESLPKVQRARLHAAFADWIERLGEGRDEHAPLLAHHYAEAVKPEDLDLAWPGEETEAERLRVKAMAWLRRAAELAAGRYALDEQISLLRRAADLEPSPTRSVRLWREIAHAHALNYDDEAFKDAMLKAIDACSDEAELAELYAEAAFQSAVRWQQEADREQIDEWSRLALELGGAESRAKAHALVARAICRPEEAEAVALEAEAIAARLNDAELHSYALHIRADIALAAGDYDEARRIAAQRLDTLARIDDPDHRADAFWAVLPMYLGSGRFDDARRIARLHDEVTVGLTSHHRLHGVAVLLEVEQLAGDWERIRELAPRAERVVEQNTTRCLHNRLVPLTCALASAYLGDEEEALRLEARSEESGIDHYGRAESLIWLALHRGDLTAVERLLGELEQPRKSFLRSRKLAPVAARLDALAALGKRETLERDAPLLLQPEAYLGPFALRAPGIVREDETLIEQAVAGFRAMGLDWHAAQTQSLL